MKSNYSLTDLKKTVENRLISRLNFCKRQYLPLLNPKAATVLVKQEDGNIVEIFLDTELFAHPEVSRVLSL